MYQRIFVLCAALLAGGCSTARYFDESGDELPGMPFVWKDAAGEAHLAYVRATSGFGEATFSLDRREDGGYTKFTNNLDSTGAARLTESVLSEAFEAGRRAAWTEAKARILELEDAGERETLLRQLRQVMP